MVKFIRFLIYACIFAFCIALVVIGQRNIGWWGIGIMITGLAGLLVLLGTYNRKYR